MKQWLVNQGFDSVFLDFDKELGISAGSAWETTLYQAIERAAAVIVIVTPSWLASRWCFAEFSQARALGKVIFPVVEESVGDAFIAPDLQYLDLTRDREAGLASLHLALDQVALGAESGFSRNPGRPPYPGLAAFEEEDAAVYFGRDEDTRRLIEQLNATATNSADCRVVVVLGASGVGKSSFVRAGVIPRVKQLKSWFVLPVVRPDLNPIDGLAHSFAAALNGAEDRRALSRELATYEPGPMIASLVGALKSKHGQGRARGLLVIDQLEEIFSQPDSEQVRRFLHLITAAASGNDALTCLVVLRSDFYGLFQSHMRESPLSVFSLAPIPLARIPQIIEGPARVAGIKIDDELVTHATRDAETPSALPLLAFMMRELYDRFGSTGLLTLKEYLELGSLENSVSQAADLVLARVGPHEAQLQAIREAFIPWMVRINDDGQYTRRAARWEELPSGSLPFIEEFVDVHLLVVRHDGQDRIVEVAHEALLRSWPRLRSWLDEEREFIVIHQEVDQEFRTWREAPESEKSAALLVGARFERAALLLSQRQNLLTSEQRQFVDLSLDRYNKIHRKLRGGVITRARIWLANIIDPLDDEDREVIFRMSKSEYPPAAALPAKDSAHAARDSRPERPDIFVSYSRKDKDGVRAIVEALQDQSWSVWWDPKIIPGDRWDELIADALGACRCVVVIWTDNSIGSFWVKDEAAHGRDANILVPISIDGTQPPLGFRQWQAADFSGWSGDRDASAFSEVVSGVNQAFENRVSKYQPRPT